MPTIIAASADIAAPLDAVWRILVDVARYPQWNPFTPEVETSLGIGDPVVLHVQMRPDTRIVQTERVTACDPAGRLCWGMRLGTPWLLAAERCQTLEPLPGGGTRYITADVFRGALVPLVIRLYGADIQRGFDAVARALKTRAES